MFLVIVIQRFSSYDLRIHTDFRSAVSSLVVVVFLSSANEMALRDEFIDTA